MTPPRSPVGGPAAVEPCEHDWRESVGCCGGHGLPTSRACRLCGAVLVDNAPTKPPALEQRYDVRLEIVVPTGDSVEEWWKRHSPYLSCEAKLACYGAIPKRRKKSWDEQNKEVASITAPSPAPPEQPARGDGVRRAFEGLLKLDTGVGYPACYWVDGIDDNDTGAETWFDGLVGKNVRLVVEVLDDAPGKDEDRVKRVWETCRQAAIDECEARQQLYHVHANDCAANGEFAAANSSLSAATACREIADAIGKLVMAKLAKYDGEPSEQRCHCGKPIACNHEASRDDDGPAPCGLCGGKTLTSRLGPMHVCQRCGGE